MITHFFAILSRMKYINRWGLMRNTQSETISEHSLETAIVAHALAVLRNTRFHGNVNEERVALLAIFHDSPEIITGDLPTPIKYHNPNIRDAYREVESLATWRLIHMLPSDMQDTYSSILNFSGERDREYEPLVKAADKISALIKCLEEKKSGNREFVKAEQTLRQSVEAMELPEATVFLRDFLPSYELTLDEHTECVALGHDETE